MKFFLCFLLTLSKVLTSQANLDYYVMKGTIDINVDEYKDHNNNTIKNPIEAYRSTKTDEIIQKKETSRYGELEWHSIGSQKTYSQKTPLYHFLIYSNLFLMDSISL